MTIQTYIEPKKKLTSSLIYYRHHAMPRRDVGQQREQTGIPDPGTYTVVTGMQEAEATVIKQRLDFVNRYI
jgi:hypothetical protein